MRENVPSDICANEDSNEPVHLHSLISLFCQHEETAFLAVQNAPSEDSDEIARECVADLNLLWVHMCRGTFSDVAAEMAFDDKESDLEIQVHVIAR